MKLLVKTKNIDVPIIDYTFFYIRCKLSILWAISILLKLKSYLYIFGLIYNNQGIITGNTLM